METIEENVKTNSQMVINDEIKKSLTVISKWTKFLAILGFVGLGFIVVAAIFMVVMGNYYSQYDGGDVSTHIKALFYIILAVVYYFPLNYLIKSAKSFKKAVMSDDQEILNSGFANLKSHFNYMGILAIVLISLYILIFFILMFMRFYRF